MRSEASRDELEAMNEESSLEVKLEPKQDSMSVHSEQPQPQHNDSLGLIAGQTQLKSERM